MSNIYYYVPEQNRASWGAGMIYYQVWLLRKNNFNAHVLHDTKPYKLSFIKLDVSFRYINDKGLEPAKEDFLIIPEFYANLKQFLKFKCRKIVFVQNAYYIFDGLKNGESYEDLGIEQVFYYMPHLKKILQQITALPLYETPPFVASYFYNEGNIHERKRSILIYPKFDSRDYIILKRMLEDRLGLTEKKGLKKWLHKKSDWQIVELKNKSHQEVAEEMKQAAFFICLNTTESFNAAVPEAMAAGCINICYEGVGPADFLENDINAYVFSNNHVFELVDKVIGLVTNYGKYEDKLKLLRNKARATADTYTIESLENKVTAFFKAKD